MSWFYDLDAYLAFVRATSGGDISYDAYYRERDRVATAEQRARMLVSWGTANTLFLILAGGGYVWWRSGWSPGMLSQAGRLIAATWILWPIGSLCWLNTFETDFDNAQATFTVLFPPIFFMLGVLLFRWVRTADLAKQNGAASQNNVTRAGNGDPQPKRQSATAPVLFRIAATIGIGGMIACLLYGTVFIWIKPEFQDKLNEPVLIPPVITVIAAIWMQGANFWQRIIAGGAGLGIAVILTFGGIGGMAYAGANSGMAFQAGVPAALLALRMGSPLGLAATVLLLRRARRLNVLHG